MRKALGLDIGYGGLKVVGGDADFVLPKMGRGMYAKPATAGPSVKVGAKMSGPEDAHEVLVGKELWKTCFDLSRVASQNRNIDDNYTETPGYKALFHTGLLLSGMTEIDMLVTGLPVSHSKEAGKKQKLIDMMKGIHEVSPGRYISVKDVAVIPQPYGGYMLWESLLADKSGVDPDEATIVVVDPGTYSVDWAIFEKRSVRPELNGSSTKGSFVILSQARSEIKEAGLGDVSVSRLEAALTQGKPTVLIGGENVEIAKYVALAAGKVVPDVVTQIKPNLRVTEGSADRVILVGGGSEFFRSELIREWGEKVVVVPENPVTANAAGFFLYGCEQLASQE